MCRDNIKNVNFIKSYENRIVPVYEDENKKYQFHSFYNVQAEGELIFKAYYDKEVKDYLFVGFGFGYHIEKFLSENINITIVVLNEKMFNIAKNENLFRIEKFTKNLNVKVIMATEIEDDYFLEKEMDFSKIIFHSPAIEIMENSRLKDEIIKNKILYNTQKRFEKIMNDNIIANRKFIRKYLSEYLANMTNKNIIIVGAGPSLNSDLKIIKKVRKKVFLFVVGTALKSLIDKDVIPDAIIITDPNIRVIEQITNVDLKIPLLMMESASKYIPEFWKGDIFLCAQTLFNEKIRDNDVVKSGGSVITTALDIAINVDANLIILAGVDFSYPNEYSHVDGAHRNRKIVGIHNLKRVKNYSGSFNYAPRNLMIYNNWIAKRSTETEKKIYNITLNGAIIDNTVRITYDELAELLKKRKK